VSCLDYTSLVTDALDPDTHPFRSFEHFLLYYSQKDLTKVEDRLNAIAGIFCRLEMRMKCEIFEGLPTATLDAALLFDTMPFDFQNRPTLRRREFPSYSWTGWSGIPSWSGSPISALTLRMWKSPSQTTNGLTHGHGLSGIAADLTVP
jgi:hypothetical protein